MIESCVINRTSYLCYCPLNAAAVQSGFRTLDINLFLSNKLIIYHRSIENNGCLAFKPKAIKLTYAKTVRLKDTVEAQNRLIADGGDPTDDSTTNGLLTNDQVKVDIKTK